MSRDFDEAAFYLSQFNAESGGLIGISPRDASAAENSIRNLCTGDGQDDFFVIPHHFTAVRSFCHRKSDHVWIVGEIGPP